MKKVYTLIVILIACYGAQAQVTSGEKFLGGGVSITSVGGSTNVFIFPELKYAHAENRLLGVRVGIGSSNSSTSFVVGPNYTWIFPIKDNLFWLLTGYADVTFGEGGSDLTLGAYPGLGYRIHDRILLAVTNSGVSYSTRAEMFSLNAGLSGLSLRAYLRIGKGQ